MRTPQEWFSVRESWNRLNRDAAYPSVFRTFEWTYHWWRVFLGAEAERMRLLVAQDADGQLVAVFPLHRVTTLARREWRMVGESPGHHFITEEPTLLVADDAGCSVLDALLAYLRNAARADWDFYRFDVATRDACYRVEEESGVLCRFNQLLYRQTKKMDSSVMVALPTSWEAFRATLSRSMRDNLTYYPRRLVKDGYQWTVRFLDTPGGIQDAMPLLTQMHGERSVGGNGTRCHVNHLPTESHVRFVTDILSLFAERGEAFIAVLDVDGSAVAAQAFFTVGDVLTFYYSGFRTAWNPYSPPFILATEVIRRAILGATKRINFLPSDDPWKKRWGAVPLGSRYRLRATQLSWAGLFHRVGSVLRKET